MSEVTILIRAAADPSLRNAFRPLEESVRRGRAMVSREVEGMGQDRAGAVRRASAAEVSAINQVKRDRERANQAILQAQRRAAQDELRVFDQAMASKERARQADVRASESAGRDAIRRSKTEADAKIREDQRVHRARLRDFDDRLRSSSRARATEEREILRDVRAQERMAGRDARRSGNERYQRVREMASGVRQDMGAIGRAGIGFSRDMLTGAGVDTSIGSIYGRSVELERRATELSNSGYNANDPRNSKRRDPAELTKLIKESADANGYGRVETAAGLQAFVGKTGDLQTGLDIMKELGKVSKATGTDMNDMLDAAGDVSNALGDNFAGDRGQTIISAMKGFAGQGKIGAVEIKDLAQQMAKLSAATTAFEGRPEEIMATMGGLAQMSRKLGGSATATQAATSVLSMVNTLKTPARMAQFREFGVDILNEKTGMLKNPEEIILDSIEKAGTDPANMKKMWANTGGARAVEGFATTYRRARGDVLDKGGSDDEANAAGRAAVKEAFASFRKAALNDEEINTSFAARMGNTDSRAQLQNNRMEDVAQRIGDKLLPAFEKLAPIIEKMVDSFGGIVAWAAANPMLAVTAALVASIGKAAVTAAVSEALKNAIMRSVGSAGGGGAPVAGAPGGGGGLSTTLAPMAAMIGTGLALDQLGKFEREGGVDALTNGQADKEATQGTELDRRIAAVKSGNVDYLERLRETKYLQAGFTGKKQFDEVGGADMLAAMGIADPGADITSDIEAAKSFNKARAINARPELVAAMGESIAVPAGAPKAAPLTKDDVAGAMDQSLRGALSSTLNVNVTNMPAAGGPFVDPSGIDDGMVEID